MYIWYIIIICVCLSPAPLSLGPRECQKLLGHTNTQEKTRVQIRNRIVHVPLGTLFFCSCDQLMYSSFINNIVFIATCMASIIPIFFY